MLGGGITASRTYHNGDQQVEVQIVADSPMLQGLAALIGSPLAAVGGMKTVVIGGRRMSYTENDNSYMTLVADKVIVKVEGNADTPDPTLKSFIGAIDFAGDREAGPTEGIPRSVIVSSHVARLTRVARTISCCARPNSGEMCDAVRHLAGRSALLTATSALAQPAANDPLAKIGHIVVIFEENRSFDNFFGKFPGANGFATAGDLAPQIGPDGKPYKFLPAAIDSNLKPPRRTRASRRNCPTSRSRSIPTSRWRRTPAI